METEIFNMYEKLGVSKEIYEFGENSYNELKDIFDEIDKVSEYNQLKVINAMQECKVSEAHLLGTTGYGYDDIGRDNLENVYAKVFNTEDALVRSQITCGTHALSTAISANVRPGDEILYISGKPYDTLEEVIGIRESLGSLKEWGVTYNQVELINGREFDFEGIKNAINNNTKLVGIQRSKGYQTRETLSVSQIGEAIKFVKSINPNIKVMVDNCYGEFVETKEPSDFGADMIVGSLIKNPGGGLAPIGGYICGTKECIDKCAVRLTSPGLGKEVGPSLHINRSFYQGLFLAPSVTANALKTAIFAAAVYEKLGFKVIPSARTKRHDIIQAIEFNDPRALEAFCCGIQQSAPVDGHLIATPAPMPGYDSDVIMAAGAFVSGSSIELSADGPMKEPFAAYFQGGLTYQHGKFGIIKSMQYLKDEKLIKL